jgi:hypothetical protein
MSVHDIHMDDRAASIGRSADLIRQVGEVRGQNRGCEFNQPGSRNNAVSQIGVAVISQQRGWESRLQ